MDIRLNHIISHQLPAQHETADQPQPQEKHKPEELIQKKSSQVLLSSQAQLVQKLISSFAENVPYVDSHKVNSVQQAISDGMYRINHQALAKKMLNIG